MPVLQTLTVLSDGEEEQMEQKMGIENGYGVNMSRAAFDSNSFSTSHNTNHQSPKRKVGRPITSVKTMNR